MLLRPENDVFELCLVALNSAPSYFGQGAPPGYEPPVDKEDILSLPTMDDVLFPKLKPAPEQPEPVESTYVLNVEPCLSANCMWR